MTPTAHLCSACIHGFCDLLLGEVPTTMLKALRDAYTAMTEVSGEQVILAKNASTNSSKKMNES